MSTIRRSNSVFTGKSNQERSVGGNTQRTGNGGKTTVRTTGKNGTNTNDIRRTNAQGQATNRSQVTSQDKRPNVRPSVEQKVNLHEQTLIDKKLGDEKGTSASGRGPGGTRWDTNVRGPHMDVESKVSASINPAERKLSVDVNLKIDANVVKGTGKIVKDVPVKIGNKTVTARVTLSAESLVGANGELKLSLNVGADGKVSAGIKAFKPGGQASAEAFAGAKGTLGVGVMLHTKHQGKDIALAEAKGSITFAAGVGAGVNASATQTGFKWKAYAAAGVGIGTAGEVNLYAGNVRRAVFGF